MSLKQRLHLWDTKALQLLSDLFHLQSKKSLKKWLDFPDKKELQLWLDLLQIQSKKSSRQWLDFSDKRDSNYCQMSIKFTGKYH